MNNEADEFYKTVFGRTAIVIGNDGIEKLRRSRVLVCGLGGVGSYTAAALARSGVGGLVLCDADTVAKSNINRQLIAFTNNAGKSKVEVMKEMVKKINPFCEVDAREAFITAENIPEITSGCDYVVDAVDTLSAKLELAVFCKNHNIDIISSMGTGNKLYPERLELADIYETSVCPLAKVMRKELKKRGVCSLTVCYSREEPVLRECENGEEEATGRIRPKRRTVGSVSFVPSVAGLIIAGHVIREIAAAGRIS